MKRIFCLLVATAVSVRADDATLKSFESSAHDTATHATSHHGSDYHRDGYYDSGELWLGALIVTLAGSAESLMRVAPDSAQTRDVVAPREFGEPLIPFATIEADAHYVDSDISGFSGAFEVGYGPFAFRMRQEQFTERIPDAPDTDLTLTETVGLLRLSGGSRFELDIGGGEIAVDGETRETQAVFTLPVRWLILPGLNVSFRPTWGRSLATYDAAIEPGFNFLRLRLGYRWTTTDTESISGPYAGASLTF